MSLDEWIEVTNFSAVGTVIKDIAAGTIARPNTPAEFQALCNGRGAGMAIHDPGVTQLHYVDPVPLDTMMIILPNIEFLTMAIGGNNPRGYPIGAYYKDAFRSIGSDNLPSNNPPIPREMSNPQEIEAFRMFRIGEYCTNKCM